VVVSRVILRLVKVWFLNGVWLFRDGKRPLGGDMNEPPLVGGLRNETGHISDLGKSTFDMRITVRCGLEL